MSRSPERQEGKEEMSPSSKAFLDELWQRLPRYARLAKDVPPEAPGSVEWLGRIGKFWWQAREQVQISRVEVAKRLEMEPNNIVFLEAGAGYPELGLITESGEINPDALGQSELPKRYAEALGKPELYDTFREKFNLPPITTSQQ